jgi:hypothetical protein
MAALLVVQRIWLEVDAPRVIPANTSATRNLASFFSPQFRRVL